MSLLVAPEHHCIGSAARERFDRLLQLRPDDIGHGESSNRAEVLRLFERTLFTGAELGVRDLIGGGNVPASPYTLLSAGDLSSR